LLSDPDPANLGFACSPDGSRMAVVSIRGTGFDRTLYVLDLSNLELKPIADPSAYFGPSWQPLPPRTDPDSATRKIQDIQDSIAAIQQQLAAIDRSTQEGADKAAALTPRLAELQQVLTRPCAEAGNPEGC
jgi:hypothetical protein